MLEHAALTERIIGLGIEVHRQTGPGLLESVYEDCLCMELSEAGIRFQRQVVLPIRYKGRTIKRGLRADLVVCDAVLLEIKAVAAVLPVHEAQLQTYLRLGPVRVGLLFNFHALRLKDDIRRMID